MQGSYSKQITLLLLVLGLFAGSRQSYAQSIFLPQDSQQVSWYGKDLHDLLEKTKIVVQHENGYSMIQASLHMPEFYYFHEQNYFTVPGFGKATPSLKERGRSRWEGYQEIGPHQRSILIESMYLGDKICLLSWTLNRKLAHDSTHVQSYQNAFSFPCEAGQSQARKS